MNYEHDTERWLRSQSKIYALRKNFDMARVFEQCADDVAKLKAEVESLKSTTAVNNG